MVVSENSRNPKKKAKRLNSVRGTQRFTRPSQPLGTANVIINTNDAIPKLQQLSQKYIGVNNPHGFLTDLRNALGIPDSSGASKYGEIRIPQSDGSLMKVSLRITNHNSNAETYITHNANYPFNLSILIRKNFQKNRFKPHNNVVLHEYVYYGKKMENIENPLSQIVNSIIGYLQTGKYKDTTGVAMVNTSPKQTSVQTPAPITGTTQNMQNNKTDKNESKNMNKKNTIRLTESELKKVITESVKNIMSEGDLLDFYKYKEDKSGKLSEKILILRSDAIQLYEFINKGDGLWGYRVGDSREIQQERLNLASDIIKAINKLYKSVNEDDFNKVERFRKFGV